jgi:hypothetical protein
MNRKERRRAKVQQREKPLKVGDMIFTATISAVLTSGEHVFYWIRVPDGMTNEQAANTQQWHGPFKTEAEAKDDQLRVLLGPDCEVTEGGTWARRGANHSDDRSIDVLDSRRAPIAAIRSIEAGGIDCCYRNLATRAATIGAALR